MQDYQRPKWRQQPRIVFSRATALLQRERTLIMQALPTGRSVCCFLFWCGILASLASILIVPDHFLATFGIPMAAPLMLFSGLIWARELRMQNPSRKIFRMICLQWIVLFMVLLALYLFTPLRLMAPALRDFGYVLMVYATFGIVLQMMGF